VLKEKTKKKFALGFIVIPKNINHKITHRGLCPGNPASPVGAYFEFSA